jgi:sulfite reductase (NADPH) hemoprotein beta-component
LGRLPHIAHTIRDWIEPSHILSYVEAILRVYNIHGRRDNIHKARIKIIVGQMGIDTFRALVEEEWQQIKDSPLEIPEAEIARIHAYFADPQYDSLEDLTADLNALGANNPEFGKWLSRNVVAHKTTGYAIVNVSLKHPGRVPGDITADGMDAVADLADRYSFGEIRVSHRQNLVLVDVKQSDLYELWEQLSALELATPNIGAITDVICCPGLDYCALANARSIPVAQDISRHFAQNGTLESIGDLTINISGCMNACGHHHVGNIGILGVDKRGEEFFQLTLGGSSAEDATLGDRLGRALAQEEVPAAIQSIVDTYKELREDGERFLDTYRRIGIDPFKDAVYGPDSKRAA